MTKYEEEEIYCDKIFEKLSTMNESEVADYLSKLDESAIVFSLKRQVSRIERGLKKQEKALDHIAKIAQRKDPNGQNEAIKGILGQINKEKELMAKFNNVSTDAVPKTLGQMKKIAQEVDSQSNLLGKNTSGNKDDAGVGSKELLDLGKKQVKDNADLVNANKAQDLSAADTLLNTIK